MLEILQEEFGLGDIKVEIKVDTCIMSNRQLERKGWSLYLKPCYWCKGRERKDPRNKPGADVKNNNKTPQKTRIEGRARTNCEEGGKSGGGMPCSQMKTIQGGGGCKPL